MIDVSVIIVCMNNLNNIIPCLDSVRKYTNVSYEIILVAYLFEEQKLQYLRNNYPAVKIIESKDIRGFSENNNLAIREARGHYCFILNDDTIFPMDVIGLLYKDIENLPSNVAIISPCTYFPDGRVQSCGRPKHSFYTYLFSLFGLWKEQKIKSKFTYKKGIFKTYDIVGAAFLVKKDVLIKMGMFDERYFFCPEDIALSSKLNKNGYEVFVDANVKLLHVENGTATMVKTATLPASMRGELIFYSRGSIPKYLILGLLLFIQVFCKFIISYHRYLINSNKYYKIKYKANLNVLCNIFTHKTPKEIFVKYYDKIRKG